MAVTSPPTLRGTGRASHLPDRLFRGGTRALAWVVVGVLILIGIQLAVSGSLAFSTFGLDFITGTTWDPVKDVYGALPYIFGTLAAAAIAIILATPLGILTSVYLAELAPRRVAIPIGGSPKTPNTCAAKTNPRTTRTMRCMPCSCYYGDHFSITRLFLTLKTPATPLAATFARFRSNSLPTTPSRVTLPFLTMMWIGGTAIIA